MELEQLKELWGAQQERLEKSVQLNSALLAHANLGGTRRALRGLSTGLAWEIAGAAVSVLLFGSFAADHVHQSGLFVSGALIWAYSLAILLCNVRVLVDVRSVDWDEPVVAIQMRLERLRLRRAKIVGWLLLFGPLLWLPATAVVLSALAGVDLYAGASPAWIVANVLFGIAFIPLCIWIARAFGTRFAGTPAARSLIDAIAGHSVTSALESLDSVRRFKQNA
jgi:hypothetical protein